jgi:hypothetical protein
MSGLARVNARRDSNEVAIVAALREAGCLVERISGDGIPDLLVWSPGLRCVVLLEVKGVTSRKRLSDSQRAFGLSWTTAGAVWHVVSTPAEAVGLCR